MNAIQSQAIARLRQLAANTALDAIAEGIREVADQLESSLPKLDEIQSPQSVLDRVCKAMECPAGESPVVWAAAMMNMVKSMPDPIVSHDDHPNTLFQTQAVLSKFPRFPGG